MPQWGECDRVSYVVTVLGVGGVLGGTERTTGVNTTGVVPTTNELTTEVRQVEGRRTVTTTVGGTTDGRTEQA